MILVSNMTFVYVFLAVLVWISVGVFGILWHESRDKDLYSGEIITLSVIGAIGGPLVAFAAIVLTLIENLVIKRRNR